MRREWLVAAAVMVGLTLGAVGCQKKTTPPVNTGPETSRPLGDVAPQQDTTLTPDAPVPSDAAAMPTAPTMGNGRVYIVQKGDGLMAIARKFYNGDASQWRKIAAANNIQNPNSLKVGQKLVIP